MAVRRADAVWEGSLNEGSGRMRLGSGAFEGTYSFATRFEESPGTNPEELIAAAHAGCFSMALAAGLGRAGYHPSRVATSARAHLGKIDDKLAITRIDLTTEAAVPGLDEATFLTHAEQAKGGCIVSRALAGVEIRLEAKLL